MRKPHKRRPIKDRFWEKVAKTDGCWEWAAGTNPLGYGKFLVDGAMCMSHRVAYELSVGPIPHGMFIDHICHNRGCVRPDHLRLATNKQNAENRSGPRSGSKSGVRGVYWQEQTQNWVACVTHHGQQISVGSFKTLEEAEAAVVAKRLELFTHNEADKRRAA